MDKHEGIDDDIPVRAKLIAPTDDCETGTALYQGNSTMQDGEVTITLNNVAAGTYTGCGLIDVNGNTVPDGGDYYIESPSGALTIPDDTDILIENDDWIYIGP